MKHFICLISKINMCPAKALILMCWDAAFFKGPGSLKDVISAGFSGIYSGSWSGLFYEPFQQPSNVSAALPAENSLPAGWHHFQICMFDSWTFFFPSLCLYFCLPISWCSVRQRHRCRQNYCSLFHIKVRNKIDVSPAEREEEIKSCK